MRHPLEIWALLCLLAGPAGAELHFARPAKPDGDVYLWPGNLHLGYGFVGDAAAGAHGFGVGLDVATFSHDALVIDVAMARLVFRSSCANQRDCGIGGDFFVGTRGAWAHYLDRRGTHQITLGGVAGWGSLGEGWSDRISGDGQLLVGPSLRYAAFGLAGVEIIGLVPVLGEVGAHRPFGVLVNLVGLGTVLVAVLGR